MKRTLLYLLLLVCASCDPPRPTYLYLKTKIPAKVMSPEVINLRDSVCLYFKVPQFLELINEQKVYPYYTQKDGAEFGIVVSKADSTRQNSIEWFLNTDKCDLYASIGTFTQFKVLNFERINEREMIAKAYFIPKQKGIYFLQLKQAGHLSIDNNTQQFRTLYDYEGIELSHQKLIDAVKKSDKQNIIDFLSSNNSEGLPIYVFEVK
jgi:hypothetical protein